MTATELKKRAIALAEKTKIDSVTPEEVGQLSNDIVEYIENVEINGSSLGIRKTYTSVSAMEADSTAPKDDKGVLLRRGMLVNIYNQEEPDSADNGKVFSFQNPGWAFRGTVDAGYATKEELTELSNNVGLYNVDKNVPLGIGFYTSTTARAAVPTSVRKLGLIITYKTDATTSVTEQFIGSAVSAWNTDLNWKNVGSEGGNKILAWNTDVATTRKQVPQKERKAGMQISYKPDGDDWVNEQYVGTSFTDTEWAKDSNWEQIPNQSQLETLASKDELQKLEDRLQYISYGPGDDLLLSEEAISLVAPWLYINNLNIPYGTHIDEIRYRAVSRNETIFYKAKLDKTTGKAVISDKTEVARYTGKYGDTIITLPVDVTLEEGYVIGAQGNVYGIDSGQNGYSITENYANTAKTAYLYSLITHEGRKLPTINDVISIKEDTELNKSDVSLLQDETNMLKKGGIVKTQHSTYVSSDDENIFTNANVRNIIPSSNGVMYFGQAKIEKSGKLIGIYTHVNNVFRPLVVYVYKSKTNEVKEIESLYVSHEGYQYVKLSKTYDVEIGDYIGCSEMRYRGFSNVSLVLTYTDGVISKVATNSNIDVGTKAIYYTEDEIKGLVEISNEENDSQKYVSLQEDNMNYLSSNWEAKDWSFTEDGAVPNSTGSTSYLRNTLIYHSDKRYMKATITMGTDTVLRIPVIYGGINAGEGASCFAVDFKNKRLKIYSVGDGSDDIYSSLGYNVNTVLNETEIPESVIGNRDYIVELHKDDTLHKLILIDTLTAKRIEVSHNGWGAGRQNQHYTFYVEEGTLITIKKFQVYSLNRPDIVFVGDSITEGVMVTDRTKRYAAQFRENNPDKKVVISARGADNISGILAKFDSEYNIYRPKMMSVLIGANGGNTLENLQTLKDKCDNIGCKLILNRRTCQQSSDAHISGNEMIEQLNLPGARFDIATAKDNYPLVDETHPSPRYNESIYYDAGLHPNNEGQTEMYNRLYIDIPEIFI